MDQEKSPKPRFSTRLVVGAILGATALLAGGFVAGLASVPTVATPTTTSAEAGFSRDMQAHHLQAVEMSMIVRDASDDEAIRGLAYDIALTQSQQAGQMFGWLSAWGLPQAAPEPSMTWMTRPTLDGANHDHSAADGASAHVPGGPMPGMATHEQMETLKTLSGVPAETYFLELMITHHVAGVEMSEAILDRSTNRAVTSLARGMVAVQQSEIDYMNELLAERAAG